MTARTFQQPPATRMPSSAPTPLAWPAPGTIEVWSVPLREDWFAAARLLLDAEESARSDRFLVETPRLEWTVARAALRVVVGQALGQDARQVCFFADTHGKPSVAGASGFHFNLTHTSGRALIALGVENPLGIDLEVWSRAPRMGGLEEAICAPQERTEIERWTPEERNRFLLRLWTAKEAYLKAVGLGLGLPPTRVRLAWQEDGTARVACGLGGQADDRFVIRPVPEQDAAGYVGHLATQPDIEKIVVRNFGGFMLS